MPLHRDPPRFPQRVLVHCDSETGEMSALNFYSRDEAQAWLRARLAQIELTDFQRKIQDITGEERAVLVLSPDGSLADWGHTSTIREMGQRQDGDTVRYEITPAQPQ